MGKIGLYFQISLDGIVSNPDRWATIDDELMQDSIDRYDDVDAVIFGSETYPSMAEYWTNAEKAPKTELEGLLAKRLNAAKKYVVSRGDIEIVWNNSEQLKFTDIDSLANALESLKNTTEKNISVESGVKLWQVFIQNSLFDGICSHIHPVIAGQGEKLYQSDEPKTPLYVKNVKRFNSGVVKLDYQKEKRTQ